ncbi:MAG TPA: bifunctional transaldolase/phosoglucose isomerase [Longimicrobiales bacterium]|nr:bifunctional transaldolase/phosoglucose isomerase [Longimicrobiales bacterium]
MDRSDTPLHRLLDLGQSYWLDNLTREKLRSGELERRVAEEGLRGVTSNPAIFQKAIVGHDAYREQMDALAREGADPLQIYEALVLDDIREACDVLRPVYDASDGADGFVSLELSPYLAHDAEGSMRDARRLFGEVDRPNVLIKIPGTPAGVPAIEEMIYEGVNVNVTLLFSVSAYEEVARAYVRALERRLADGKSVDRIASVASFFLSRIDVLVDRLLGRRLLVEDDGAAGRAGLMGKAAVASARVAYRSLQDLLDSQRWKKLEKAGARPQRLLWASTGTKDPLYSDIRYVEPLIGPHTVNTLPDHTIDAFARHGTAARTVDRDLEEARGTLDALPGAGVDLDRVTWQLMNEGVEKFIAPFDVLLEALAARRAEVVSDAGGERRVEPEDARAITDEVVGALAVRRFARRLHARDASLWTDDPAKAQEVRNRLGWLSAPAEYRRRVDDLERFAQEVAADGIEDVVLLGMGGSSLAADVARRVFGRVDGHPAVHVLDDTAPGAVTSMRDRLDPARSLFVVASKSGTTAETLSLYRIFFAWVEGSVADGRAGRHFVAVTDQDTSLAREARTRGFLRVFENREDMGGRYSALSWFGLVPMALQGVDTGAILDSALHMRASCGAELPERLNPGVELGATLAGLARRGRDKVTLVLSAALRPFGDWVEQLLAESTGKDGTGLVPVVGEPLASPEVYGDDRLFVHLTLAEEDDAANARALSALESAGHPVVRLTLDGRHGLGAEFYRWEVATAAAAAVLGVDAFDQPDVEAAKSRTRDLLSADADDAVGSVPEELIAEDERLALFSPGDRRALGNGGPAEALSTLLRGARAGDYLALLPYMARLDDRAERVQRLRTALRDRLGIATTVGFGPRYLHSTGQLHKGGPSTGIFVLVTVDEEGDLSIPGETHGLATLHRAQAMGDYGALAQAGRRVVRIHLKGDVEGALGHLAKGLHLGVDAPLVSA